MVADLSVELIRNSSAISALYNYATNKIYPSIVAAAQEAALSTGCNPSAVIVRIDLSQWDEETVADRPNIEMRSPLETPLLTLNQLRKAIDNLYRISRDEENQQFQLVERRVLIPSLRSIATTTRTDDNKSGEVVTKSLYMCTEVWKKLIHESNFLSLFELRDGADETATFTPAALPRAQSLLLRHGLKAPAPSEHACLVVDYPQCDVGLFRKFALFMHLCFFSSHSASLNNADLLRFIGNQGHIVHKKTDEDSFVAGLHPLFFPPAAKEKKETKAGARESRETRETLVKELTKMESMVTLSNVAATALATAKMLAHVSKEEKRKDTSLAQEQQQQKPKSRGTSYATESNMVASVAFSWPSPETFSWTSLDETRFSSSRSTKTKRGI